jgi:hypothetical protein
MTTRTNLQVLKVENGFAIVTDEKIYVAIDEGKMQELLGSTIVPDILEALKKEPVKEDKSDGDK